MLEKYLKYSTRILFSCFRWEMSDSRNHFRSLFGGYDCPLYLLIEHSHLGRARQQLIKDVIIALVLLLIHDARFFEQVVADGAAARLPLHV